jgi:hypothetical protein
MAKEEEELETVVPKVDFLGFPWGGRGTPFKAGVESAPLRKSYAQLLRDKGLVADKPAKADAGEKSKA